MLWVSIDSRSLPKWAVDANPGSHYVEYDLWHLPAPFAVGSVVHMKTPTTRQKLLRARRYLIVLGLAGVFGLEAFAYLDLHHHTSLGMPLFFVTFGIFIASGALISNALRCPKCALQVSRCYRNGAGKDLHFCANCGADFNAPLPRR